jgi:hypothetical protein
MVVLNTLDINNKYVSKVSDLIALGKKVIPNESETTG